MSDANGRSWAGALAALDANLLVALDALLQEANVTSAAKRLGVTQSAMSQTLGRLRRQFDDPILVKVGRHMEPTPFGQRIRVRLRGALAELEAVVSDRPHFDPSTASIRFVIACVDYLATVFVPPLQTVIAERAPSVRLAVHSLDESSIVSRMGEGVVDLYIGVSGLTEGALKTDALYDEELCVVLDPAHPQADGLTVEAYAALPHVHVSPRREPGSIVDRALAAAGQERHVAIEVPYFSLVPMLLSGTDRVATVPGTVAKSFAQAHGLVVLPPPLTLPTFGICMAWHPAFDGDPALRWLRDVVGRVAKEVLGTAIAAPGD